MKRKVNYERLSRNKNEETKKGRIEKTELKIRRDRGWNLKRDGDEMHRWFKRISGLVCNNNNKNDNNKNNKRDSTCSHV